MKAYRQGDVSIIAVSRIPQRARKIKGELVLTRGEVTGHAHRIVEGQAFLYRVAAGLLYLRVLSESAKLYHEEHEDIMLPKCDYEIRRQREFDPFAGLRGGCVMGWTKTGVVRIKRLTPKQEHQIPLLPTNGTRSRAALIHGTKTP
jgi:hypothetical protein